MSSDPATSHARQEAAELLGLVGAELTLLFLFAWGMVWYFRAPMVPKFISAVVVRDLNICSMTATPLSSLKNRRVLTSLVALGSLYLCNLTVIAASSVVLWPLRDASTAGRHC